jgi:hypothetical protein
MENCGRRRNSRSHSPSRTGTLPAIVPQRRGPGSNFRQHLFNMIFMSKLQFSEGALLAHSLKHFCVNAPEELNRIVGKRKLISLKKVKAFFHFLINF